MVNVKFRFTCDHGSQFIANININGTSALLPHPPSGIHDLFIKKSGKTGVPYFHEFVTDLMFHLNVSSCFLNLK